MLRVHDSLDVIVARRRPGAGVESAPETSILFLRIRQCLFSSSGPGATRRAYASDRLL
jgi:hypothetical protein